MTTTASVEPAASQAKAVAAIDIGANGIRMVIAQVFPDGRFEQLEQLQRAVRLGQDTFRRGRLSAESLRAAVAILRDYRKMLDLYNVKLTRTVATSAVREAVNADAFLDRVLMATGLEVSIIETSEESRLTVSAVRSGLDLPLGIERSDALIAEVGGGSTLLTILHHGEIAASQSLRLGSIRLQEMLATTYEPPARSAELLRHQIANVVSVIQSSLPLKKIRVFIAVGGDARFAAGLVGKPTAGGQLHLVPRAEFDKLVERCTVHTTEELAKRYGLSFSEAETLNPALLVYQALLHATRARELVISHVSMRDGLVMDLANQVAGKEDAAQSEAVLQSATAIAEKYRVDFNHARNGLRPRHRLLLRVAGLLHEVGGFVSSRAHHKHSYYLLANSEIFGLTREEILIVALAARYHRRSSPKPAHLEYMALPRETRMVVSKLAALLRVADALDRGHAQQVSEIHCERREDELFINVPGVSDLTLERRALAVKADLFEEIYGLKIHVEEEQPAPRAAPTGPIR
jgi:exopolyphosphatase/guanosine-5'-triphosphate,3'-diphosphate pyrophosphatase